jgi:hypothetical protein
MGSIACSVDRGDSPSVKATSLPFTTVLLKLFGEISSASGAHGFVTTVAEGRPSLRLSAWHGRAHLGRIQLCVTEAHRASIGLVPLAPKLNLAVCPKADARDILQDLVRAVGICRLGGPLPLERCNLACAPKEPA